MKFKELLESKMSRRDAVSFLALTDMYTQEELKASFKEKAKTNHPDKGGSTELMQKTNAAYEILKLSKASVDTKKFDWNKVHKEYTELCKNLNTTIKKQFNKKIFTDYFKEIFGQTFSLYDIQYFGEDYYKGNNKPYGGPSYAGIKFKIESKDGNIVIDFNASVYLASIKGSKGLTSSSSSIPLTVNAEGFFAGRKFKLFNKTWGNEKVDSFNFNNVEVFFPRKKLEKHLEKKKTTKATKKDFLGVITKILKGDNLYDDVYACPIKGEEDIFLVISRGTMMRKGYYNFNISKKVASRYTPTDSKVNSFFTLSEAPEILDMLLSLKDKSLSQIEKILIKAKP